MAAAEAGTMPLHERETVSEVLEDCVFAGRDLTRQVPKYRFPRDESAPKEAFQVVADDYYGFDDDTTTPNRAEAEQAVNTIAELYQGA